MIIKAKAFSLVEILIALLVVSLMAVNITGLQQKVSEQQANNIAHATAISMVAMQMEKILGIIYLDQLIALDNKTETEIQGTNTIFSTLTTISDITHFFNAAVNFKEITLTISWLDTKGNQKEVSHSQQINAAHLFSDPSEYNAQQPFSKIIASTLAADEIIYFEPNKEYDKNDFVIHDSYLYQATSDYLANGDYPRIISDLDGEPIASDGWHSYGQIDDPTLKNESSLASLFLE